MKFKLATLVGFSSILIISLVLRPPVATMGPLLHEISLNLGLSTTEIGILAASPVLCFGLGAFTSPWLVRKYGLNRSMLLILVTLLLASIVRLFFGYSGLLIGTLGVGLSIAVANVLLPTVVRVEYANRVPLITGVYTTVLALSASFAAAAAVPTSEGLGGWQASLAIWLLPVGLAILLWLPKTRFQSPHVPQLTQEAASERTAVIRSPITWAVVGIFGLQSLGFYSVLGWLPSMLSSFGFSPGEAGAYLGLATAVGIPFGLALSIFIGRFRSLSIWVAGASLFTLAGFTFLLFTVENSSLVIPAAIFMGLGQASSFPLSLSIIGTRASTKAQTTQLSALAQGVGYLIAAIGTFLVGALEQSSGHWILSILFLMVITIFQVFVGYLAGRPGKIPAR